MNSSTNLDQHQEIFNEVKRLEVLAIHHIPDNDYEKVARLFVQAKQKGGRILFAGVGRATGIGHCLSMTFCGSRLPSVSLNAIDSLYGGLGVVSEHDILVPMENTGSNPLIHNLITLAKQEHPQMPIIYMTGNPDSQIAQMADVVLLTGRPQETCVIGLVPTCSMTAMLTMGHIILSVYQRLVNFGDSDFNKIHFREFYTVKFKQRNSDRLKLTKKEMAVIQLLQLGADRKIIAKDMNVTPSGVDYHTKNIYKKLGVNTAKAAVAEALSLGIITI